MRTEHGVVLGPFKVEATDWLFDKVEDVEQAITLAKSLVDEHDVSPDLVEIWVKVPVRIKKVVTAEIEGMRK